MRVRTVSSTFQAVLLTICLAGGGGCESGSGGGGSGKGGMDNVHGTMTMKGTVGGEAIDAGGGAYALRDSTKSHGDVHFDDIQVGLLYQGDYLGLEIEQPERMVSGGRYSLSSFPVDLEGALAGKHYGYAADGDPEVRATGGSMQVSVYEGDTFTAAYSLVLPDGSSVAGTIHVTGFDSRVR